MADIILVGSYQGFNLESFLKIELEKIGYSVSFFQCNKFMGSHPSLLRMAVTRNLVLRSLSTPFLLNKVNEKLKAEISRERPKFLFVAKGEMMLPSTLDWIKKETSTKSAMWYPDDPNYFDSFNKYLAPHYDFVFTASPRAIPRYKRIGVKSVDFVAFGCNPDVHRKVHLTEDEKKRYSHDISFVGACYPRRFKIMRKLEKYDLAVYGPYWRTLRRKSNYHNPVWGPELVKVFNASKIVLDIYFPAIRDYEVTMRTFEATGCGSFLLTERGYELHELFTIGKELVCYNDELEIQEIIEYYLDADDERNEIAAKGQERAYREHTNSQRVKFMLDRMSS